MWRYLAHGLLHQLRSHLNLSQLEGLPGLNVEELLVVDGSLFDCLAQMKWATYRQATNKIRLHFFYALDGLPEGCVRNQTRESKVLQSMVGVRGSFA